MGFGWESDHGKGMGRDSITSGMKDHGLLIPQNETMVILTCFLAMSGSW